MKRTIKVHAMLRTAFVAEVELDVPDDTGTEAIEEAVKELTGNRGDGAIEWKLDGTPEFVEDGHDEVYEFEEV